MVLNTNWKQISKDGNIEILRTESRGKEHARRMNQREKMSEGKRDTIQKQPHPLQLS